MAVSSLAPPSGSGSGSGVGGGGRRLRVGDVTLSDCGGPRQKSRSVSWNSNGAWLASASSDRLTKIWAVDGGGGQGREIQALTGHSAAVERVRFHPADPHALCTAAADRSVRFWDVRGGGGKSGSSRCTSKIDLQSNVKFGSCVASVEWHPYVDGGSRRYVAVSEKDSGVRVYDQRKLGSINNNKTGGGGNGSTTTSSKPVRTFHLAPHVLQECHFSPSGTHLVAATRGTDGMGELRVWKWDDPDPSAAASSSALSSPISSPSASSSSSVLGGPAFLSTQHTYVGHTGPCYVARFSPDGTKLATGGADALVGLWDVASMTCTTTIARRTKFVRSVAYSHDSALIASCSEEDGVDVADASTGERVGVVALAHKPGMGTAAARFGVKAWGGADEVAWHPKAYVLACARGDNSAAASASSGAGGGGPGENAGGGGGGLTGNGGGPRTPEYAQVTVAKINIVSS